MTKSDQNTPSNAPNCTVLKNFLGGACPRTPLAMRMANSMSLRDMQIPKSEKKNSWPPPSQILGTPLVIICCLIHTIMSNNSLPCQVMTPVDSCHYHCIKDGCAHVHVTDKLYLLIIFIFQ